MMKRKKSKGNVVDGISAMICILGCSILVMACIYSLQLINKKEDISQLARKYILRMETVGYLTSSDETELRDALSAMGVTNIDLSGTTTVAVSYGNAIVLNITGEISGMEMTGGSGFFDTVFAENHYAFSEKKVSTAKN